MPLKSHPIAASETNSNTISLVTSFVLGSLCGWLAKASLPEITLSFDYPDKLKLYTQAPSHVVRFKRPGTIEACVSDIESAMEAVRAGMNSLELCVNRVEGGVTPSSAFIEHVSKLVEGRGNGIAVNVLIRPRPGSFVYSEEEFELLTEEIQMARQAGATGIVTGVLTPDGKIHEPRMRIIRKLTEGLVLTYHRAFDVCKEEPDTALRTLFELGVDRLLSSGRMDRVTDPQACALLSQLHDLSLQLAADKYEEEGSPSFSSGVIQIVAAAGIKPANVGDFLKSCKVTAVHCGSGITSKRHQTYYTMEEMSTTPTSSPAPTTDQSESVSVSTSNSSSLVSPPSQARSLNDGEMMSWDVVSRRKAQTLCKAAKEVWLAREDTHTPSMVTAPTTATSNEGESNASATAITEDGGDVHVALTLAAPAQRASYIVVDGDLNEQLHSDSPPTRQSGGESPILA